MFSNIEPIVHVFGTTDKKMMSNPYKKRAVGRGTTNLYIMCRFHIKELYFEELFLKVGHLSLENYCRGQQINLTIKSLLFNWYHKKDSVSVYPIRTVYKRH